MNNFVVFGASGDLAKNYLFPALENLNQQGHKFKYFGFSRSSFEQRGFSKKLKCFTGSYDGEGLAELAKAISQDSIYYFAIPTNFELVSGLVNGLKKYGLIGRSSRLVVEKPFGEDQETAEHLMKFLNKAVGQDKVVLVDHYLTKELVRNMVSLRFANSIFSNLWNETFISEIKITTTETKTIADRAGYYDKIGAIKDMVQNHCLQLLALTTMDQPRSFQPEDFVKAKLDVLNKLELWDKKSIEVGQYKGYLKEKGVESNSKTETYAKIKFKLNKPGWEKVPITMVTGKKMAERLSEIKVVFKPMIKHLWGQNVELTANFLVINFAPDNDISLTVNSSFQPHKQTPNPIKLHLGGAVANPTTSYENVILDILDNVKINSPSFSEITAQWKIVDEILAIPRLKDKLLYY